MTIHYNKENNSKNNNIIKVMMFSATMTKDVREVCKKFMHDPHEIRVDEESKLTLHG